MRTVFDNVMQNVIHRLVMLKDEFSFLQSWEVEEWLFFIVLNDFG